MGRGMKKDFSKMERMGAGGQVPLVCPPFSCGLASPQVRSKEPRPQPSLSQLTAKGATEGTRDRIKCIQHSGTWNLLTGSPKAKCGLQMGFVGPAGF